MGKNILGPLLQEKVMQQETTFDRSLVGKLSRRIHLPADIKDQVIEERFVFTLPAEHNAISDWFDSYSYKDGWSKVWLPSRHIIMMAEKVEVIKRQHKSKPIKIIIFRVWKDGQQS